MQASNLFIGKTVEIALISLLLLLAGIVYGDTSQDPERPWVDRNQCFATGSPCLLASH